MSFDTYVYACTENIECKLTPKGITAQHNAAFHHGLHCLEVKRSSDKDTFY